MRACVCLHQPVNQSTRFSVVFFDSLTSLWYSSNRFSRYAPNSRTPRARLYDIPESRFPFSFTANALYISSIASSRTPCHLIIVMKLTGYLPETLARVFLFPSLCEDTYVCGTRVWTVSLANNRSRRFLRSRPTGFTISSPHLIPRDIPGRTCRRYVYTCIPIYTCMYKTVIRDCRLRRRLEIETRAPLKVAPSVAVVSKIPEVYSRVFRAADFFFAFSSFSSFSPSLLKTVKLTEKWSIGSYSLHSRRYLLYRDCPRVYIIQSK